MVFFARIPVPIWYLLVMETGRPLPIIPELNPEARPRVNTIGVNSPGFESNNVLRARISTLDVENRILREKLADQRNYIIQLRKNHESEFNNYRRSLHECLDSYESDRSDCYLFMCWCTTAVSSLVMGIHDVILSMNRNQLHRQTCEYQPRWSVIFSKRNNSNCCYSVR